MNIGSWTAGIALEHDGLVQPSIGQSELPHSNMFGTVLLYKFFVTTAVCILVRRDLNTATLPGSLTAHLFAVQQ